MTILKDSLPVLSTKDFTWNPKTKVFSAEASDFGQRKIAGRVFDDAMDVGFVLVSERTGTEVIFAQSGTDRDDEGELLGTYFSPIDRRGYSVPNPQYRVLIIND